ncbi:hypothetical protein GCM10007036_14010 [Alsobacter metallidurans]|uniref:VRR-NUC domain-containing protein n=1 Tax=Alsobacter metallidurans TaxID=340221 RepID=A0A917MH54_9HYPH|nr:VRR-NUC domain-containing protein [Alsobacter metallidurans]GGH14590.1 hypothetical protein GCM10007036_14010 [Alsobacter metallidurans]
MVPRANEDAIQIAIVTYLRMVLPRVAKVFHVPNGGKRNKSEAAKLKAMGVLPGVPDILIMVPPGRLYLAEVKSGKGTLEPEQQEFAREALQMGFGWCCVRSIDDMRKALAVWQVETCDASLGSLV